jgi:hypothetical protein
MIRFPWKRKNNESRSLKNAVLDYYLKRILHDDVECNKHHSIGDEKTCKSFINAIHVIYAHKKTPYHYRECIDTVLIRNARHEIHESNIRIFETQPNTSINGKTLKYIAYAKNPCDIERSNKNIVTQRKR